ncbi:hypothetical protein NFI96_014054 [Prochilodus magdalenae]|nr:hypothetical protein NFI96_014054 [Prochilodus magdalenae]
MDMWGTTTTGNLFFYFFIQYEKCVIGNDGLLPFAFNDIKGLEGGHDDIMQTDVISALKGHVKEGYVFNPTSKLTEDSQYYLRTPSLNEKIQCLVNVIPADKISLMENEFTENMKNQTPYITESKALWGPRSSKFPSLLSCKSTSCCLSMYHLSFALCNLT